MLAEKCTAADSGYLALAKLVFRGHFGGDFRGVGAVAFHGFGIPAVYGLDTHPAGYPERKGRHPTGNGGGLNSAEIRIWPNHDSWGHATSVAGVCGARRRDVSSGK